MLWAIIVAIVRVSKSPQLLQQHFKKIKYVGIGVAGLCLVIALAAPLLFEFKWSYGKQELGFGMDESFEQQLLAAGVSKESTLEIMGAIRSDRAKYLRLDALRSLVLVGLCIGLLWAFWVKKIKPKYLVAGIAILVLTDLWLVGKRYLNNRDFVDASHFERRFPFSLADKSILEKATPHDRVLDLTTSIFQDAKPGYFHNSIGGNHGAKLRRYQDVIDGYLNDKIKLLKAGRRDVAIPVLNMLDTRFFKTGYGENDYLHNITSLGFAWFPQEIVWAKNADEEFAMLDSLQGAQTVILHEQFRSYMNGFRQQPLRYGKVELLEYLPGKVIYLSLIHI